MRPALDTDIALHTLDEGAGRDWLMRTLDWRDAAEPATVARRRVWPDRDGAAIEYILRHPQHAPLGTVLVAIDREIRNARAVRNRPRWRATGLSGIRIRGPQGHGWCITPDQDPRLPLLRSLLRKRCCPADLGLPPDPAPTLINYRALGRAVLRCAADGRIEYAKILRRPVAPERVALWQRLGRALADASANRVQIPVLVAGPHDARVVRSPRVPRGTLATAEDVGTVLVAMQQVRGLDLPWHGPDVERHTVQRWVTLWARLTDGVVPDAVLTVQRHLAAQAPTGPVQVIHRDFHTRQVLSCGTDQWLLDLDTLALGHTEVDVATWSAHAFLHELQDGRERHDAWHSVVGQIRTLTATGVRIDPLRLNYYLPGALCRLGLNYALRRVPADVTAAMWRSAADLADGTLRL